MNAVKIAGTDAEKLANLLDEFTRLSMEHASALSALNKIKSSPSPLDTVAKICNQTHRTAADRLRSVLAYIEGLS